MLLALKKSNPIPHQISTAKGAKHHSAGKQQVKTNLPFCPQPTRLKLLQHEHALAVALHIVGQKPQPVARLLFGIYGRLRQANLPACALKLAFHKSIHYLLASGSKILFSHKFRRRRTAKRANHQSKHQRRASIQQQPGVLLKQRTQSSQRSTRLLNKSENLLPGKWLNADRGIQIQPLWQLVIFLEPAADDHAGHRLQ
jgi:hypothetical protein